MKTEDLLMTPDEVQAKKAVLDARLVGGDPKHVISVAFGLELYDALVGTGDIHEGDFGNMAHRLEVPGAPRRLRLPAYGHGNPVHAIARSTIPHDAFVVGMGGYEVP